MATWVAYGTKTIPVKLEWNNLVPEDSTKKKVDRSKPNFTPKDRQGDPFSNPGSESPLLLDNPSNIEHEVTLDSVNGTYTITEKVGDMDYRTPSTMTFDEYMKHRDREMLKNYWNNRSSGTSEVKDKDASEASLKIPAPGIGSIFGKDFVEIKPNGSVTLDFAGKWQRTRNPNVPVRNQRTGGFEFDQQISLNIIGTIGDKLKLTANWDTKASFDFQNNLKLQYTGYEEDIIQSIEAGNVSFPVNSPLISGSQNLFGVKTNLQFGRLKVSAVASTQRGKKEELKIKGGSLTREIDFRADNYDEYRNFFLAHFFRKNYEPSLKNLPAIISGVKITRVDVYVTNTNNNTQNNRTIIAYTDLGESDTTIYNGIFRQQNTFVHASNDESGTYNSLYRSVKDLRNTEVLPNELANSYNMANGSDYVIINNARKLDPSEYRFHPELGYVSLNTNVRLNEVIAVAYQYSYNGANYTVGEIPGINADTVNNSPLIMKMLKPNNVNTRLTTWDLMMKNVYQLGSTQITPENFKLNIIYKNDQSGADLPFFQEGRRTNRKLLLRLTGLDRLGPNNDPPGDGNFDYIEGVTIDSRYGKIIFPVLEPFGSNLEQYFDGDEQALKNQYVFTELYDSTKSDMLNYARKNKYFIKGQYQGSNSSTLYLSGINLSPGSVVVTQGANTLREGTDYEINYQSGQLRIINQGLLESGQEISVRYESADLFNFRRKSFFGTRFDYRFNKDFNIGATVLHQSEAPQVTRVSLGDEPSKNTIAGLDVNFTKESRFLTKAVDKLPVIQTKAPSTISFQAEGAGLFPGHSRAINKGDNKGGVSYIDDFEGARTPYDLTRSPISWKLSSTPLRFPESTTNGLEYTYNRAKLAWYNVDQLFYIGSNVNKPNHISDEDIKNHFVRQVVPQEVFPFRQPLQLPVNEPVLNLAYYPTERGPYNYNPVLNSEGRLQSPSQNWGGITRAITSDIDFDQANIQYIEFWMMSPYINSAKNYTEIEPGVPFDKNNKGKLYFNLGSISEDIMKDQRHAYENGLPANQADANNPEKFILNEWGKVTKQPFLTNAFDNNPEARPLQDVGLDGLNSAQEAEYYSDFINQVQISLGQSSVAYSNVISDPSADNFRYYLDTEYDNQKATILQRYKNFNGMENNSPINATDGVAIKSNTSLPDNEDINNDNNVDVLDEYYEYEVDIDPSRFIVGQNHIVDKNVVTDSRYAHGDSVTWYQFRIPIREFDGKTGNINGFKSLKFLRMYMTGFESPVVLRMAQMQLVANQWRVYLNDLDEGGIGPPKVEPTQPEIVVSTVNIEENGVGDGENVPYVVPPGFDRDQDITSQVNRQLNEQSLQICVDNLGEGQARSAFKYVDGLNLLNYKRIKMFLSAQTHDQLPDSAVTAFMRIGTDFEENYYEIEVPLHYAYPGRDFTSDDVWKSENRIDVALEDLVSVKLERNQNSGGQINYRVAYSSVRGNRKINVVGNPDLSSVQTIMLGLKNPFAGTVNSSVQTCIWANELLVSDFIETAGYAATASMNMQLADLATVTSSVRYIGAGFGSLEQKVSERALENTLQYSIGSNIALDKFVPAKIGLKLPFYVGHDKKLILPRYDPLDPDVKLNESISSKPDDLQASYRSKVIDETTTNSWNFTNIRKVKTKPGAKNRLYDIENLALSFGVTHQTRTNANMQEYDFKNWKGGLGYTYNNNAKVYEPFKNIKAKSPYLKAIKDFNFSLMPSTISVRTDLDRRVTKTVYYAGSPLYDILQDPIYSKSFTNTRNYGLNWNFTRNLTADFSASTFSVFDEPDDSLRPGSKIYNEALWDTVKTLGRMKNYNQTAALNYKVPLDKFPLTDWLGADTRYASGYTWTAGALDLQDTLGNMISNKQDMSVNGRINLDKLYNKVPGLKKILNEKPPAKKPPFGPQAKTPSAKPEEKDSTQKPPRELKALKQAVRSVLSLKVINANYTLSKGTSLAGYLPGVDYMGIENGQSSMLPYVFGSQDPTILTRLRDEESYSKSATLNTPFTQFRTENINLRTSLEPVRDFRIQLDMLKNKTINYEEIFRLRPDSATQTPDWFSDAPNLRGSYNISFIAIRTAFQKDNSDNSSEAFRNFESYLAVIQSRKPEGSKYNRNSHEIMIPALIAAYSGTGANDVKLTSFPKFPLPNWRIDYNGLTRIKKISKWFSLMSLSHGYQSTFTISGLSSSLEYSNNPAVISPGKDFTQPIDAQNMIEKDGKFVSPYIIDQVVITEKFSPLIGVNFRTKTKIEGRLEYVRDRTIALSMSNSQIQEIHNNGIVLGLGFAKAGIKLPIASGGNPTTVLKNEVKFRVDFAIKNGKTVQHRISEGSITTAGNLNWQLKPTINYLVNQRLNLTLYFERTVNEPKISSSFKRSTTAFGIQLRFTLS